MSTNQIHNSKITTIQSIDEIKISKQVELASHKKKSFKIKNNSTGDIAILKNISASIRSDQMTAILGPSGSGKTTLLNFVSSRSNWDSNVYVDGKLFLNEKRVKYLSQYKHLIGFVPQQDNIPENLTVQDVFETYGLLRGVENYKNRAADIIRFLRLEKCKNNKIGADGEGRISGGEKKRTCIGVELMSNPKILFLDESTTGLDAFTAVEVIRLLKNLNQNNGLGVVTVIHQPRQEILDLFDKVTFFLKIIVY